MIACPKCGCTDVYTDAEVDPDLPHTCTACYLAFSNAEAAQATPDTLDADDLLTRIFHPNGMEAETHTTGEIIGWRAWHVIDTPEGARLQSLGLGGTGSNTIWTPGTIMEATCSKGHTDVPHEGLHCCGFYTGVSKEHLVEMRYNNYTPEHGHFVVIGQVALCGKVIPGDLGWRSQYAWPVKLYVPYGMVGGKRGWEMVKPLREAYGIPVELDNTLKSTKVK